MQVKFFRNGNSRLLKVPAGMIQEALGEMSTPVLHMFTTSRLIMLLRFKFDLPLEEQHSLLCEALRIPANNKAQSEVVALTRNGDLEIKKARLKETGSTEDDLVFYAYENNLTPAFLAFYFCKANTFVPEILTKACRRETVPV
jgi:hypothetical protein